MNSRQPWLTQDLDSKKKNILRIDYKAWGQRKSTLQKSTLHSKGSRTQEF